MVPDSAWTITLRGLPDARGENSREQGKMPAVVASS